MVTVKRKVKLWLPFARGRVRNQSAATIQVRSRVCGCVAVWLWLCSFLGIIGGPSHLTCCNVWRFVCVCMCVRRFVPETLGGDRRSSLLRSSTSASRSTDGTVPIPCARPGESKAEFMARITFHAGPYDSPESFKELAKELTELEGYATTAIGNWEMAVAATVIHYINDVRADIYAASPSSEGEFSLKDYAKHWGEAKGFGLWFQFNPHSPLVDSEFAELHELLGHSAPTWDPSDMADAGSAMTYYDDLETARDILCDAYAFEADNCANW